MRLLIGLCLITLVSSGLYAQMAHDSGGAMTLSQVQLLKAAAREHLSICHPVRAMTGGIPPVARTRAQASQLEANRSAECALSEARLRDMVETP